ncbi:hypothetical protein BH11MYX3_BH11MYX3_21380 [soil metagenome]
MSQPSSYLFAFAVSLVACEHPRIVAPPSAPLSPDGDNIVRRVCGTPLEAELRARLRPMVACGNRVVVDAHVEVNEHVLDVVGYDGDPCCTDTGPPEMMEGATVYYDSVRYDPAQHGGQPVTTALGSLGGLSDGDARALMQAMLVMRGARAQVLSAADQDALVTRWPAARLAITRSPPGLTAAPAGRTLRVWNERRVSERGISCRLLERHELTLSADGRLVFGDPVVFGEGERMGQPCGEALPVR